MLCPSRDRPPHGHATTRVGSSGFSAGLISLPAVHELPLDDSSGDADSKVDLHPPCPIQIGVFPQSRQTPDLGNPASQLTAVGHTRDRAATGPAAVIPHHSLDAENTFLNREEDPPPHHEPAAQSPPAPMHNTNATADLSTGNGTPAILGQHNDCPDRDDTEWTRPVTTPSVPPSHDLHPPFVPLEHAYAAYDASLSNTYISDDVVLFWHPPSVFSQWTTPPLTLTLPSRFAPSARLTVGGTPCALWLVGDFSCECMVWENSGGGLTTQSVGTATMTTVTSANRVDLESLSSRCWTFRRTHTSADPIRVLCTRLALPLTLSLPSR